MSNQNRSNCSSGSSHVTLANIEPSHSAGTRCWSSQNIRVCRADCCAPWVWVQVGLHNPSGILALLRHPGVWNWNELRGQLHVGMQIHNTTSINQLTLLGLDLGISRTWTTWISRLELLPGETHVPYQHACEFEKMSIEKMSVIVKASQQFEWSIVWPNPVLLTLSVRDGRWQSGRLQSDNVSRQC